MTSQITTTTCGTCHRERITLDAANVCAPCRHEEREAEMARAELVRWQALSPAQRASEREAQRTYDDRIEGG